MKGSLEVYMPPQKYIYIYIHNAQKFCFVFVSLSSATTKLHQCAQNVILFFKVDITFCHSLPHNVFMEVTWMAILHEHKAEYQQETTDLLYIMNGHSFLLLTQGENTCMEKIVSEFYVILTETARAGNILHTWSECWINIRLSKTPWLELSKSY